MENTRNMVNTVHKVIINGNLICFIINTDGDNYFWLWEISRATWNNYWKDKNPACLIGDIMKWAANEFVNSDECSDRGCSCAAFDTIEEALKCYLSIEIE